MTRSLRLGVTGNIACGKSTVMAMLTVLGVGTIDADAVYHELIVPQAPLWLVLRDRFGPGIVAPDGTIDRRALGGIVFADSAAMADLDALTHPPVIAEIERRAALLPQPVVAVDAVKLIESGHADGYDAVWLVTCDPAQQIARLMARNGLDRADAARRVGSQPPSGPKLARADQVIDNSGDLAATRDQVERAWRVLCDLVRRPISKSTS